MHPIRRALIAMYGRSIPVAIRFWAYTEKTRNCWIWRPSKGKPWRPLLRIKGKTVLAARFSWELHYGEIPDGMCVCHKCDNPQCVRPDHLFLGTALDNMRDCIEKGRFNHGTRGKEGVEHGLAKLTDDDVRTIRRRYDRCKSKFGFFAKVGREYGISNVQCRNIALRLQWRHLD